MSYPHKLSLTAAILININIMIGAGIFVNTVILAQNAGPFGALVYAVVATLLLPLIITFARLMKYHKGGTFYDFGASLSPFVGFVSGWSYFIAKLGSASLGIHVFSTLAQQLIPSLAVVPLLTMDGIIVFLFVIFNMLNIRIGQTIQFGFLSLKSLPIVFAIAVGFFLWASTGIDLSTQKVALHGIVASLPFVLYAFTGFEACCSLSRTIAEPEKNGPKALLISYGLGVTIVILYQLMFYGGLGEQLARLSGYSIAFPTLLSKVVLPGSALFAVFFAALNIGIATSSLGAAYGIMYSNAWNLFVLGNKGHTFMPSLIAKLNRHNIPFVCVVIEGMIIAFYLLIFRGNLVPLQQICSLGMITTYFLCTIAFVSVVWRDTARVQLLSILALASCGLLMYAFKDNISAYGILPTLYFMSIVMAGIAMYLVRSSTGSSSNKLNQ
jgi:amino acid transporter